VEVIQVLYKFKKHSIWPDVPDFYFEKEFPSAYRADRYASKSLLNHNLSWCVIFLAGEEAD
jgi:hypothetical protein